MRLHEPQVVERRAAGGLLVDAGVDGERPHADVFQLSDPFRHVVDADHVDDDGPAVFGGGLQAGRDGREIGHAERGDVVGARLERQPRLVFARVHDLDVGEHLDFRKSRLERAHRGEALGDDERRPDLENIDNSPGLARRGSARPRTRCRPAPVAASCSGLFAAPARAVAMSRWRCPPRASAARAGQTRSRPKNSRPLASLRRISSVTGADSVVPKAAFPDLQSVRNLIARCVGLDASAQAFNGPMHGESLRPAYVGSVSRTRRRR